MTLHWKIIEAVDERSQRVDEFEAFGSTLPVDDTVAWTLLVQIWEKDATQPSIFESKLHGEYLLCTFFVGAYSDSLFSLDITVHKVRLQLAEDDGKRLEVGSVMVHANISIEELQ